MRVIIAGSRGITKLDLVYDAVVESKLDVTEVVSGGASGVDTLGEQFAADNGIPMKRYPADWNKYGKQAGFIRNTQMAENAEALIAIWDGSSRGTQHMINIAERLGLKVYVKRVP